MIPRSVYVRRTLHLVAWLLVVASGSASQAGLIISFDYTYDSLGFFDDSARRDLLELAAGQLNRFIDELDAIVPSESDHWKYHVPRPDHPNWAFISDDTIPADTVKVYVGGRDLSTGFLAMASIASTQFGNITGSPQWHDTINYRGQIGAAGEPATDYSIFAGSITYNQAKDWHFGATIEGLGSSQTDFLTVTMHELSHLLGIGPADSWHALISDGRFTGAEATAVGSSNNPELILHEDLGHWQAGTRSEVGGASQQVLLDPYTPRGKRQWPTELDRAALRDVGWQEAAPGDVNLDRMVSGADIEAILAAGKFASGPANATWVEGDFDGNQEVNGPDIQAILAANLFGQGPYAGKEAGAYADGTASLLVAPEGVRIDAHGAAVNGYVLASEEGIFTGQPADNLGLFREDTDFRISGNFAFALDGTHRLGQVIGDEFAHAYAARDLTFTYTLEGKSGVYTGSVLVVPEPGTVAMLAGVVLVLLWMAVRRR